MASACVNNIGVSPKTFLDCPPIFPAYGWLSPRISFSRDFPEEDPNAKTSSTAEQQNSTEKQDPEVYGKDFKDFEFRLEDPVTMLPADELFSDGKLVPLQLTTVHPSVDLNAATSPSEEIRSPEEMKSC
ncbi:uncharacterized protein LOC122063623 [Macadamia integrifolia]|uniref:uncharacterized protein LOC122063623 n=1 Tax=Macadamia integrifolia TaxID=60698 RepID=UPI001C4E5806|nr:uncharacterized protein LOC122063623 [Macadamia integrifolia]